MIETLFPKRLGTSFRWLVASSWVSNLGDGIALAAGPLLVASLTDDPFLVAFAATLQWLPPLLFGLFAGVVTDRVNRQRLIVTANLIRAAVLVVLTLTIVADNVSIQLVLGTLFLLGTAEVFADNTASTLLPMLVDHSDLTVGNARLMAGFVTLNQLAGPPLGAALFAVGWALPFSTQAVLVALGAGLVTKVTLPLHGVDRDERHHVWREIIEGISWTRHHPAVRTLVLTIFTFNITFGAAWAVLVLYATEHLGLGEIGFGLITTVIAVGGLVGTLGYDWITARVSLGNIMRIGLIIETLTHLGLASTASPLVAMPIFFVFGVHAFVWGTTSVTIRQRAVPTHLQGRVSAVNVVGVTGGLVVGSLIGGAIAQNWGLTAPFWFGFIGSAVFVVLIWGELRHISHDDEAPTDRPTSYADEDHQHPGGRS
jgi:predicted MFS family arabinose efflux permease